MLLYPCLPFYKKASTLRQKHFSGGHPGAQHPRTNEQSTGLFITSLSLGRPFKSCINNLSDFVFSAIKAIGAILLGFGIVQIGLALKGHDASQRAQGFMTFFGGVVIYFAKDILDMIL